MYLRGEVEVIEGDKVALQQAGEQAQINLEQALLYSSLSYICCHSVDQVITGDQVA